MAETTELYDDRLKLELLDHYERMTTKKRMSTEAMQQWLTGAAFHLHTRLHQVRTDTLEAFSPAEVMGILRKYFKNRLSSQLDVYFQI